MKSPCVSNPDFTFLVEPAFRDLMNAKARIDQLDVVGLASWEAQRELSLLNKHEKSVMAAWAKATANMAINNTPYSLGIERYLSRQFGQRVLH